MEKIKKVEMLVQSSSFLSSNRFKINEIDRYLESREDKPFDECWMKAFDEVMNIFEERARCVQILIRVDFFF
jgi:hypothetical protein